MTSTKQDSACCDNPRIARVYDDAQRAIVTRCTSCTEQLDVRKLKDEETPSGEHDPLSATHKSDVKSAVTAEAQELVAPEALPPAAGYPACQANAASLGLAGEWKACSTGSGKANKCCNSKFRGGACPGPCSCISCHAWAGNPTWGACD